MKKKIVYLIIGLLLCASVFVIYQTSQGAGVAPNPGHALTCHTITASEDDGSVTVTCDTGTATGGGCYMYYLGAAGSQYHKYGPTDSNGWICDGYPAYRVDAYVVCCVAG